MSGAGSEAPAVVRALTAADAATIATWRYAGPWSVYNVSDPTVFSEANGYHAVADPATGALVGFVCTGAEARVRGMVEQAGVLDVGVGLDPALVGQGQGQTLLAPVLEWARRRFPGAKLRAAVQEWNQRSLRLCQSLGFEAVGHHPVEEEGRTVIYVVLKSHRDGKLTGVTSADPDRSLTRTEASEAVEAVGWRYLLSSLCASIPVPSLHRAAAVAAAAIDAAGGEADDHLRVDLRPERVELSVQTRATGALTSVDVDLVHRVAAALEALDLTPAPARTDGYHRPVAMLELAIDAIDIAAIRPFWKAVLAYADDPADPGPTGAIIDPAGQQPAVWFQSMDQPRLQRNRIHFDVTVAHDEAEARVRAALDAGGRMVNDSYARMFWILADAEGNECCVCTWTDRDDWDATHRLAE